MLAMGSEAETAYRNNPCSYVTMGEDQPAHHEKVTSRTLLR